MRDELLLGIVSGFTGAWVLALAVGLIRLELLLREVRASVRAMPSAGDPIEFGSEPGADGRGESGDRTPPHSPPEA